MKDRYHFARKTHNDDLEASSAQIFQFLSFFASF